MIYENVRLYRQMLGKSQDEAQKAIGVKSKTTYIMKESGLREFTITEGILLAKFFNVTLKQLFEEKFPISINK